MGPVQTFLLDFEDSMPTDLVAEGLEGLSDAGTTRVVEARFLLKESDDEVLVARNTDLREDERAGLVSKPGTDQRRCR